MASGPGGGWGETCASYAGPSLRGRGESTASQTSWAHISLMATGEAEHSAVDRGVAFLLERLRTDGTWDEPEFMGCGFHGYGPGDRPERPEALNGADSQGPEVWRGLHDQLSPIPQLLPALGPGTIRPSP